MGADEDCLLRSGRGLFTQERTRTVYLGADEDMFAVHLSQELLC